MPARMKLAWDRQRRPRMRRGFFSAKPRMLVMSAVTSAAMLRMSRTCFSDSVSATVSLRATSRAPR